MLMLIIQYIIKQQDNIIVYLKKLVIDYFANEETNPEKMNVSVKYIDPSYMIRSVRANAFDSIQCLLLAENVVHGMMAGYTGFTVGVCNNRSVYIPIKTLTDNSPRTLYPFGRTYERVVNITGQPDFSIPMKKRLMEQKEREEREAKEREEREAKEKEEKEAKEREEKEAEKKE